MNLHLTGRHLEITPAIRDYATGKFGKLKRHFDHVIDVHIILSVEKLKQKAEATVHISGKDVFVECDDENLYAAIDALVDKLDRQIIKRLGNDLRCRAGYAKEELFLFFLAVHIDSGGPHNFTNRLNKFAFFRFRHSTTTPGF